MKLACVAGARKGRRGIGHARDARVERGRGERKLSLFLAPFTRCARNQFPFSPPLSSACRAGYPEIV